MVRFQQWLVDTDFVLSSGTRNMMIDALRFADLLQN